MKRNDDDDDYENLHIKITDPWFSVFFFFGSISEQATHNTTRWHPLIGKGIHTNTSIYIYTDVGSYIMEIHNKPQNYHQIVYLFMNIWKAGGRKGYNTHNIWWKKGVASMDGTALQLTANDI